MTCSWIASRPTVSTSSTGMPVTVSVSTDSATLPISAPAS
jgi:hypothetical protein